MQKENGFSLIELMIVVAIIGILAIIIVPSYQLYIRRAHYLEIIQAATPLKLAVQECFQVTNTLDECSAGKNSVPREATHTANLVNSATINSSGKITITPKKKYGIKASDTYTLTPVVKRGQLHWISGGGGVAHGYAN